MILPSVTPLTSEKLSSCWKLLRRRELLFRFFTSGCLALLTLCVGGNYCRTFELWRLLPLFESAPEPVVNCRDFWRLTPLFRESIVWLSSAVPPVTVLGLFFPLRFAELFLSCITYWAACDDCAEFYRLAPNLALIGCFLGMFWCWREGESGTAGSLEVLDYGPPMPKFYYRAWEIISPWSC